VRVWALLIVLPILALVLLELSLWRPARIAQVVPEDVETGEVVHVVVPGASARSLELPATALSLQVSSSGVSVVASDGGGVGELPLSAAEPIARVRVVRVRDAFAIELVQGASTYVTRIDRAGVRLDDDLPARLRDRSRPWQWLYLLCTLLFTVLSSAPVLAGLAAAAQPTAASAAADRALRRARVVALWLLPWGVGSLTMALYVLFGA
jgi:hypothetical protein